MFCEFFLSFPFKCRFSIVSSDFSLFLFLFLLLIFRARPCPSHLAALLFCFRVSLPILSPVSDFFPILGHIREFLPLLSQFCRGAATLLQDVYRNVTTILQPQQPCCRRKMLNSNDCMNKLYTNVVFSLQCACRRTNLLIQHV